MITNVLSVDVEEYYHAAIFQRGTSALGAQRFESRVEQSVERLLALLSEHNARGTFFVVGEVAAQHPAMVRRIAAEGHEIGCHSNRHESVNVQSPAQFRADTSAAKARIEDALGVKVDAGDLLRVPEGDVTDAGIRNNIDVGIRYLAAWLGGNGCVPIHHLMEDAATAEISRAQLWQWVRHGSAMKDRRTVSLTQCAKFRPSNS